MRWRGRRQSSNVRDIRGLPSATSRGSRGRGFRLPMPRRGARQASGGMSFGTIILLVIIFLGLRACGIDPLAMLAGGPQTAADRGSHSEAGGREVTNETRQFLSVVLAETEDVWNDILREQGIEYPEPQMVLFTDAVRSACGQASSASGPFYCPADQDIYLDTGFFNTLSQRFGASGDFAQAYVVAHEVGHHVQQVLGILPKFNQMRALMSRAEQNAMSVRVELQADCLAGVWAHYTDQKGLLEAGDLEEALNAASQIGDDTIQNRTQGYVVPESFNHGTSAQRRAWFLRGYEGGRLADCDTKVFG